MTQHTQPVVAAQHQQQTLTTQHQQQQQTTTTPNSNNNNNQSNNNNVSSASTATPAPSTSNNQTQTVAVQQQQQHQNNNNNNNNYQTQQNVSGPVYNPQLQPANVFVPAHNIPAHHHPQHHHQAGAMYQTMIPAALPSNVYVNNVTANVNLHGWAHTVPHSAWVHPGSAQHYIHGELPPEQGAPVMQPMTAMPVTLPTPNALTGPLMNHNVNTISGGSRGSRRGRGRVGSSGSRRSDYNAAQRHPPPEGSPVPQSSGQTGQQDLQQQQQSSDSQQMMTAVPQSYMAHPQYAAQYPYGYPAFFTPPQHMLHPGQSAAAQQATGTPVYFPTMPVYNGHPMYGYFPVLNQAEYQYVPGEEVGVGVPVGDERQAGGETGAMMWHQQPIYTDEYGNMSSADMHAIPSDDINHTSSSMGSAAETPNLLSPNYAPIYDPQMQEQMTQQMGVMQIYDDPQMGPIQVIHPHSGVSQMEDELSECGSQPSSQIQMVGPIQLVPSSATQMSLATANTEQIMHHQAPHLIPATAAAIMPTESNIASNTTPIQHQIQQQQSLTEDNTIDNSSHVQSYENVVANIQQRESVTSSNNEELEQTPVENLAQQDYHKQQQQQHQHQPQIQIQTQNVVVEAVQTDNYNSNRTIITEVQEVVVQEQKALIKTDVAVETVLSSSHTNIVKPQQQQQQTVYKHQVPEKQQKHQQHHQQQQYGVKQHQQQEYQHQQLQTQSVAPQQQSSNQQQQGGHYQQHQQPQQQPQQQQHHQQTSYENRKSSQMYNQQHQSRRKYDYHHGHSSTGSNSSNNESSNTQQHHQQQQTTKTMSWTNSSQHKKSTNTVAVTATPTSSHTGAGSYNKSSSGGATNSAATHTHTTRTYTNQQHHNYQQQNQQQQQQQNYHYQQQQHQPQTRNYGAMKMPSSPIASVTNPMERKTSQTSDAGKSHAQQQQQTTSTASTTAVPHQFQQQQPLQHQQSQQTSTSDVVQHTQSSTSSSSSIVTNTAATVPAIATNISKSQQQQQYPPGFANKKHSLSNQGHTSSGNTANAANLSTATTTETAISAPAINLAPPVTATTPAVPSTPSWASLFSSNSNSNNTTTASANASANILSSNASSTSYAKKPVAKVAPYEVLAPVTPTAPLVTPGALSYSAASAQNLPPPSASSSSNTAATAAKKASGDQTLSQRSSMANLDEFSLKFAEFLTKYKSDWATISLRPRGLTNRSNYCYINSILQALLGCSPLYNLIRSIPKQAANLCEVKTPTVNAMITFMSNFSNLPSGLRLRNPKGSKNNKDDLGSDLQCDPAFEPTEIYKLWNDSREEHVEGRQEDAEEFLSYILNKLNDEMLEVIKLIAKPTPEQNGQNEPPEEEGDAWQMICNNRNKGSVTRQTDFGCTPLSDIFRGELRSRLQREGELSTDVIQPFFTLQLNIEKAASVKEALEILVGRDQLEGVTGSKSKQEVVAWQQMNLEKLPPILILHLKWFDYRSDGCTKILKKVDFPVELKIDAKILASKKYSQKQRAYRLFAVVYHDGKEATKGHYITDVYHTGYGSWLRYDDSSVKPVSENHVLLPRAPRVPYLLCYRRCDTIPQQSNNNQNSSGGNNNNNNSSGNTTQSSGK